MGISLPIELLAAPPVLMVAYPVSPPVLEPAASELVAVGTAPVPVPVPYIPPLPVGNGGCTVLVTVTVAV